VLDLSPAQVAALSGAAVLDELTASERVRFAIPKDGRLPLEQATECDHLTASFHDRDRVAPGVAFRDIDPAIAVAACELAVKERPNEGRLQYGLGRALDAADRDKEAAAAFQRTIDKGYPIGWIGLGSIYAETDSPVHDATASKEAYRKGAEAGVPAAMYFAGLNLWETGIEIEQLEAIQLWDRAGHYWAEQKLADVYAQGEGTVPPNEEESLYYYVRAAALWPTEASDRDDIVAERGSAVRAYARQFGLRQAADVVLKAMNSLPAQSP
jgi:TPR repeat protein